MERTKFDECGPLRQTLLRKLNHQRRLAISALAQLFDDDREALRKAAALRWSECADFVAFADRDELHSLMRALHKWRMATPLSMPSLADLRKEVELVDASRN